MGVSAPCIQRGHPRRARLEPVSGLGGQRGVPGVGPGRPPTLALCPQWPYCRKHCSYCSFNKYVVPAVDEAAVRACLVREARTLLRLGQVRRWVPGSGSQGGRGARPRPPAASLLSPQRHLCLLRRGHTQPGQPPNHRRRAGGCRGGRAPPCRSRGHAGGQPQLRQPRAPRRLQGGRRQPPLGRRAGERGCPVLPRPPAAPRGPAAIAFLPQSLDDAELRLLGREHTADEARAAVEAARGLFPSRTSIDLLFGLPGQSREAWARCLEAALGLCDDHLALYQLTLERGTALEARVRQGALPAPPQDLLADMYHTARAVLAAAGFRQYEVSNFARKVRAPRPVSCPHSGLCPSSPTAPLSRRAPSAPTTSPTGGLSSTSAWGRVSPGGGSGQGAQGCACPLHPSPPRAVAGAHGRFVPWGEGSCQREARVQTPDPDTWMKEVQSHGHGTRRRAALSPLEQ